MDRHIVLILTSAPQPPPPGVSLRLHLFFGRRSRETLAVDAMSGVDGASGAAARRRQRRLRAEWRHEQQSVAITLAAAFHHSAGPSKKKVVERREARGGGARDARCPTGDAARSPAGARAAGEARGGGSSLGSRWSADFCLASIGGVGRRGHRQWRAFLSPPEAAGASGRRGGEGGAVGCGRSRVGRVGAAQQPHWPDLFLEPPLGQDGLEPSLRAWRLFGLACGTQRRMCTTFTRSHVSVPTTSLHFLQSEGATASPGRYTNTGRRAVVHLLTSQFPRALGIWQSPLCLPDWGIQENWTFWETTSVLFSTSPWHPAVTCSVSALPEAYRNWTIWEMFSLNVSVFAALLPRQWLLVIRQFTEAVWTNFHIFLRAGGPRTLRLFLDFGCIPRAPSIRQSPVGGCCA